ncbi:unnamed protein product [Symbiodinium sp. CCMP2456]|nr:unnamed protein product [Symbiodinium sp. CCMP2456]
MGKAAVWKKPSFQQALKNTTKPKKNEKPPKQGKGTKDGNKGDNNTGKPQDNQALTEAALAQLENKDPQYVSEYIQNLGDKEQMRLWKKFEADRKSTGEHDAYVMATQGVGSKKKAKRRLQQQVDTYMEHMAKFSTSHVKGNKAVWQPLHFMLNMKYGARELKAKKETQKMMQHSGKCTWTDFKVLHDLENGKQHLRFEFPAEDPKKKTDEADEHLTPLIGNKKNHQFDDYGFGKAGAAGSAASQAFTADSKALRALENCEGLVAGKTVPKDKLQLAAVRAKGACGEVQSLLEEKLLETDGKEKKEIQGKIKDLKEVIKLFGANKMDDKKLVALVRRSAKVAKACSEVLSLEDDS